MTIKAVGKRVADLQMALHQLQRTMVALNLSTLPPRARWVEASPSSRLAEARASLSAAECRFENLRAIQNSSENSSSGKIAEALANASAEVSRLSGVVNEIYRSEGRPASGWEGSRSMILLEPYRAAVDRAAIDCSGLELEVGLWLTKEFFDSLLLQGEGCVATMASLGKVPEGAIFLTLQKMAESSGQYFTIIYYSCLAR